MEYIENHGNVKMLFKGSWSGSYGYGYYAFVDSNGQFVIGEERGREGGELYRGEYKGENTPWLSDIKKENIRLYNDIVKYFKEHVKKQYVIQRAYTGNSKILRYVNGKYEDDDIITDYNLHGYVSALENMGYERAYYEKEFLARIKNLEKELKEAKEWYQNVQGCFLNLSVEEAEKYEKLTYFDEDDC
jgi:hypothetical protein